MSCGADAINAQKIGGRNRELVDENGCTTPHMSLEWAAKMVVTEREARGYDPERTHRRRPDFVRGETVGDLRAFHM
jgi:hypothetical protein